MQEDVKDAGEDVKSETTAQEIKPQAGITQPEKPAQDGNIPVSDKVSSVSDNKSGDANTLAAISHALIVFLPIITPLIVWIAYKDKSRYVKNQSMQALIFQGVAYAIFFFLWILGAILSVIVIGVLLFPLALVQILAFMLYGLVAAYKTYQGENFKYVAIGDIVEKNM